MKKEKGITLIALIITIIILLILAIVSISLIINQGILDKSKKAVDQYAEAEEDEQAKLLQAEYEMAKYEGKFSGTYDEYALEKLYGVKIGDYVNYDEGTGHTSVADTSKGIGGTWDSTNKVVTAKTFTNEDLSWRVLGITNNGQIKLISETVTTDEVTITGTGTIYYEEELRRICNELYGKGSYAVSADNINFSDFNATGCTLKEVFTIKGNKFKFKYDSVKNCIQYSELTVGTDKWSDWTDTDKTSITLPGKEAINSSNQAESVVIENKIDTVNILYPNDTIKEILDQSSCWVSCDSPLDRFSVSVNSLGLSVYCCALHQARNYLYGRGWPLYNAFNPADLWSGSKQLHPVVTLQSNINLTKDASGVWQISEK